MKNAGNNIEGKTKFLFRKRYMVARAGKGEGLTKGTEIYTKSIRLFPVDVHEVHPVLNEE
jgi:hypothetical protein